MLLQLKHTYRAAAVAAAMVRVFAIFQRKIDRKTMERHHTNGSHLKFSHLYVYVVHRQHVYEHQRHWLPQWQYTYIDIIAELCRKPNSPSRKYQYESFRRRRCHFSIINSTRNHSHLNETINSTKNDAARSTKRTLSSRKFIRPIEKFTSNEYYYPTQLLRHYATSRAHYYSFFHCSIN